MQTRTEKEPTICCSKCGTTVRENPYTDMILVLSQFSFACLSQFLFVGLFKVRISKCRTEKDVQTRTEKEPRTRNTYCDIWGRGAVLSATRRPCPLLCKKWDWYTRPSQDLQTRPHTDKHQTLKGPANKTLQRHTNENYVLSYLRARFNSVCSSSTLLSNSSLSTIICRIVSAARYTQSTCK